jgi:predicted acyl esterase
MFGTNWKTSQRLYGVTVSRSVKIRMSDGVVLDADIFQPDDPGRFPALLGVHAYDNAMQSTPSLPQAMQGQNAQAEAGDPSFYARRGYAHAIVNARGTGQSEGRYSHYGPRDVEDIREVIAWLAAQEWCDGGVGMFGASYFSVAAKQVAATNPPALKAVWAMYGYTDFYRDKFYHGGILARAFLTSWARHLANVRLDPWSRQKLGDEEYARRLAALKRDCDIMAVPELAAAVNAPDAGAHPLIVDVLMNPHDGPYWWERAPNLEAIKTPIMLGACWGMYGLHLPGEFRAWERITAPKKMLIGAPIYLDRPIYQYAYASLRWFDHWLKGTDTGYMNESPIQMFLPGEDGRWVDASEWPLPQTQWHPFYLHRAGLLSEHEFWPAEGGTGYEDNVFNARGGASFTTPPLVERTEVIGPAKLTVYASTSDDDIFFFVTLWDVPPDGDARLLTRGWLKGSLAAVDEAASKPWQAHHSFRQSQSLTPDHIHCFEINLVPTANVFKVGHRIAVRVSSADEDPPRTFLDLVAEGHLLRQRPSWITIHHSSDHPSVLHLPVTSGNRIGTFMSGGQSKHSAPAARPTGERDWEAW